MKCNWMRNPRPAYCCHCCHIFLLSVYSVVWFLLTATGSWFEGLPVQAGRQAKVHRYLQSDDAHTSCAAALFALRSFLEQEAKNTIPSIQYIYMYIYFLASCRVFVFVCFVLRPYIYSALIRFIITFHFYSSSSSFLLIVFLFLFSLFCSYEFMDSNVLSSALRPSFIVFFLFLRPIATTLVDLNVHVYVFVFMRVCEYNFRDPNVKAAAFNFLFWPVIDTRNKRMNACSIHIHMLHTYIHAMYVFEINQYLGAFLNYVHFS